MLSSTTILTSIQMVFLFTLVISVIFGIVVLIWTIAKWNERSSTRNIMSELLDNWTPNEKTFTVSEEMLQQLILRAARSQNPIALPSSLIDIDPSKAEEMQGQSGQNENDTTPTEARFPFEAGNVHLRNGKYEDAISAFSKAISISPNFAEAYNARGMAYRKLSDHHKALGDYTDALTLNQELAVAYNNRGVVYREIGEFDLAISDFNGAISLEPDNAYGYCNRAMLYNKIGEFENSITDSSRAIEIDPNIPEAYVTRGISKTHLGSEDEAQNDFGFAKSIGYDDSDIDGKLDSILEDQ